MLNWNRSLAKRLGLACLLTLSLQACNQSVGSEDSQAESLWDVFGRADRLVERMDDVAQRESRVLSGTIQDSAADRFPGDFDGLPCGIRLSTKNKSPWRGGQPNYRVVVFRPNGDDLTEGSAAPAPETREVDYGSSLSPDLHFKATDEGSRIRSWTRSGLFITARTGFADLDLNPAGELVGATLGEYDNRSRQETVTGRCILDEPFAFEESPSNETADLDRENAAEN